MKKKEQNMPNGINSKEEKGKYVHVCVCVFRCILSAACSENSAISSLSHTKENC